MPIILRSLLILVSLLTLSWILHKIRKSAIVLKDAVFWIMFSLLIALLGIFSNVIEKGAHLMGFISPVNFVFLAMIFVLIIKIFMMSIHISQIEYNLQTLTQKYAIDKKLHQDKNNKESIK